MGGGAQEGVGGGCTPVGALEPTFPIGPGELSPRRASLLRGFPVLQALGQPRRSCRPHTNWT